MKLQFLGHACFLLDDGSYKVLTDPFLSGTGQTDSMRFYRCWKMPDAASGAEPISASSRRMDNAISG